MPKPKDSGALLTKKKPTPAVKPKPLINMEEDVGKVTATTIAELMVLVERQLAIEEFICGLSDKLKLANENLRLLAEVEIPSFFDQCGIVKELTLLDGTKVTVEEKVYPNIAADDWDAAVVWLKENHFDSLIKNEVKISFGKGEDAKAEMIMEMLVKKKCTDFTNKQYIHPQTLGAFVRERLAEGKDIPSAISVNPVRKSTIKKPKSK